jgi:hypothetical protein
LSFARLAVVQRPRQNSSARGIAAVEPAREHAQLLGRSGDAELRRIDHSAPIGRIPR